MNSLAYEFKKEIGINGNSEHWNEAYENNFVIGQFK